MGIKLVLIAPCIPHSHPPCSHRSDAAAGLGLLVQLTHGQQALVLLAPCPPPPPPPDHLSLISHLPPLMQQHFLSLLLRLTHGQQALVLLAPRPPCSSTSLSLPVQLPHGQQALVLLAPCPSHVPPPSPPCFRNLTTQVVWRNYAWHLLPQMTYKGCQQKRRNDIKKPT